MDLSQFLNEVEKVGSTSATKPNFEIHKVMKGKDGENQYSKVDTEEMKRKAAQLEKLKEVSNELKDYSFDERFEWMFQKKGHGNRLYEKKQYADAIEVYLTAILGIKEYDEPQRNSKIVKEIKIPCLNNIAACLLLDNQYAKVLPLCDQVLQFDPNNTKAFLRRGQANFYLKNYEDAEKDFENGLKGCSNPQQKKKFKVFLEETKKEKKKVQSQYAKVISSGIYEDKKVAYNEEEEEKKYLATINTLHWMMYPYLKLLKRVICCKKKFTPKAKKE